MTGLVWGRRHFLPMVLWVQCQVMTRAVALLLPFFQDLCHSVFFFYWENSYAERRDCCLLPGSTIGRCCRRRWAPLVPAPPTETDARQAVERYRPGPARQACGSAPARARGARLTP